jgi:hypothetical protein
VLDAKGRRRGEATRVDDLGAVLGPKAFRRITWRDATRGKLASNFCFRRVKVAVDDGSDPLQREPVWLVLEWAEGDEEPSKFFLTSLRRRMSKKRSACGGIMI